VVDEPAGAGPPPPPAGAPAAPAAPPSDTAEILRAQFPDTNLNTIVVVVRAADGEPLRADRVDALYELSRWLARQPKVARVQSPVDLDPSISREGYRQLFSAPKDLAPPEIRTALGQMVGAHVVALSVDTELTSESDEARDLVRAIRTAHPPVPGADLLVSGRTAFDLDFIEVVVADAPFVVGFVVVATYLVLVLLLGSVLLPLKAVIVNFLSITASYGALVWIFQEGHLAGLLHFVPRPVEVPIPIVMFCVLFGLSMDYEVLLLSRIREEYEASGDNEQAVGRGLEHTGRLITGAAAIMAGVFFGFGLARTIVIKAMGIAMGVAVVLDATVVRALLVPATMRLLGPWNWWAPAFVVRLYRRLAATTTR
jgi:RND superfamily putative drug exporter